MFIVYSTEDKCPLGLELQPTTKDCLRQIDWQRKGGFNDSYAIASLRGGEFVDAVTGAPVALKNNGVFIQSAFDSFMAGASC